MRVKLSNICNSGIYCKNSKLNFITHFITQVNPLTEQLILLLLKLNTSIPFELPEMDSGNTGKGLK